MVKNIDDNLLFHITADNLRCRVSGRVPMGYENFLPKEDGVFADGDYLAGQRSGDNLWIGKGITNLEPKSAPKLTLNSVENGRYHYTIKAGSTGGLELTQLTSSGIALEGNTIYCLSFKFDERYAEYIGPTVWWMDNVPTIIEKTADTTTGECKCIFTTQAAPPGNMFWRIMGDLTPIGAENDFYMDDIVLAKIAYKSPYVKNTRPDGRLIYPGFDNWQSKSFAVWGKCGKPYVNNVIYDAIIVSSVSGSLSGNPHYFGIRDENINHDGMDYLAIITLDDIGQHGTTYWEDGSTTEFSVHNFNVMNDGVLNFDYENSARTATYLKECKQWGRILHQDEINDLVKKFLDSTPKPYISYDFTKSLEDSCGNSKLLGYDELLPKEDGIVQSTDGNLIAQRTSDGAWIGKGTTNIAADKAYAYNCTINRISPNKIRITTTDENTRGDAYFTPDYLGFTNGEFGVATWEVTDGFENFLDVYLHANEIQSGNGNYSTSKDSQAFQMKDPITNGSNWTFQFRSKDTLPVGTSFEIEYHIEKSSFPTPAVTHERDKGQLIIPNFYDLRNKTFVARGLLQDDTYRINRIFFPGNHRAGANDTRFASDIPSVEDITYPVRIVVSFNETGQTFGKGLFENGILHSLSTNNFNLGLESGELHIGTTADNATWRWVSQFDIYDSCLTTEQCEKLLNTGTLETPKNTALEDACTFYIADGEVTDRVSGLTPVGYSEILPKDVGYVDNEDNNCSFQVVEQSDGRKALWLGKSTENLITDPTPYGIMGSNYNGIVKTYNGIVNGWHEVEINGTVGATPVFWQSKFRLNYATFDTTKKQSYSIEMQLIGEPDGAIVGCSTSTGHSPYMSNIGDRWFHNGHLVPDPAYDTRGLTPLINGMIEGMVFNGTKFRYRNYQIEDDSDFATPFVERERRKDGKLRYDFKPSMEFTVWSYVDFLDYDYTNSPLAYPRFFSFIKDEPNRLTLHPVHSINGSHDLRVVIAKSGGYHYLNFTGSDVEQFKGTKQLVALSIDSSKAYLQIGSNSYETPLDGSEDVLLDIEEMCIGSSSLSNSANSLCKFLNSGYIDRALTVDEIKELHEREGYLDIESRGEKMPVPYSTVARGNYGEIKDYYVVDSEDYFALPFRDNYLALCYFANGDASLLDLDAGQGYWIEGITGVAYAYASGDYWRPTTVPERAPYTVRYFKKG